MKQRTNPFNFPARQTPPSASGLSPRLGQSRVRASTPGGRVVGCDRERAFAGRVVAQPPEGGVRVGQRVACIAPVGSPGADLLVSDALVFPVPDEVSEAAAVALAGTGLAAWFALSQTANVQPGETVLVLDASSPMGGACVQLAKVRQAHVIALTSLRSAFAPVRAHGADDVVSLQETLWPDIVREHGGADVVVGLADAGVNVQSLRALVRRGRLLWMSPASGAADTMPLQRPLARGASVHTARWSPVTDALSARSMFSHLLALSGAGLIQPESFA